MLRAPALHQPPRIMLLCWCHIDYADCKLPLFVSSSLPSLIHLQRWAEVTLKAIFSMLLFFLRFQVTLQITPVPPEARRLLRFFARRRINCFLMFSFSAESRRMLTNQQQ